MLPLLTLHATVPVRGPLQPHAQWCTVPLPQCVQYTSDVDSKDEFWTDANGECCTQSGCAVLMVMT
jgi:hypothetical protein